MPRRIATGNGKQLLTPTGRPGRVHPEGGRGCRRASATEDAARRRQPAGWAARTRRTTSSTTPLVDASPPRSKVRMPSAAAPRVASRIAVGRIRHGVTLDHRRRGRGRRHRPAAWPSDWRRSCPQRRRGAVGRLGHGHRRPQVVVEGQQDRLGAGDRAEEGEHEVREAVAVAVEGRDDERLVVGLGQQAGVGGVDQHRPVGDVGVPGRRRVHLLLQHPLVDGRDRPLRDRRTRRRPRLSAARNEYSATDRHTDRSMRSVRHACSSGPIRRVRPGPRRRRRRRPRPCARPRWGGPPGPAAPPRGSDVRSARSPSRRPPRAGSGWASRRRRSRGGVMVAAFSPSPTSTMAAAASDTTPLSVRRRFSSERSKRTSSRGMPTTDGSSTRRASSRSSWPVSSPSQTTRRVCSVIVPRVPRGPRGGQSRVPGVSRR